MDKITTHFDGTKPFDFFISYSEATATEDEKFPNHVHSDCEIYVNLSGDVSFMVEEQIYPIHPGSVIITKPFEYHHCIYHSQKPHKHFWILFSADESDSCFDIFFNRKKGEKNLFLPSPEKSAQLTKICNRLNSTSNSKLDFCVDFFELINIISNSEAEIACPSELDTLLKFINDNLQNQISTKSLAEYAHMSVNTLERYFNRYIGTTPSLYIKQKRLSHAAMLLHSGESVSQAAFGSGFGDYSNFIALFKKHYGITPLQYKKQIKH